MDRPYRLLPLLVAAGLAIASDPVAGAQEDSGGGPAGDRPARGQEATAAGRAGDPLAALIAEALERNPRIAAARANAEAAEERISQAGAWEDPVLIFGFLNLRTTSFNFGDDFMTMKIVELGQRIPLPGQLGRRRGTARFLAESERHATEQTRIDVIADVKRAYGELYYVDRALAITERNLSILEGLQDVTLVRYTTGVGRQPAVLRAGLEIDDLTAQWVVLAESRRAALAELNAVLDRPAAASLDSTPYPPGLRSLAEGPREPGAFVSPLEIGRRGGVPGLPSLDSLLRRAVEGKPELRAHVARIEAQEEAVRRAGADRWPAPRLTLGFAQRDGFDDMMNATVSFSLPIFLGAKQNAAVREEEAALARERAVHGDMVNEIQREVTAAYSRLVDAYGRLGIFRTGILVRAEANLEAALVAYRAGAEDFLTLLDSQSSLYRTQLEYHRLRADLLSAWAELERAVGEEIEP